MFSIVVVPSISQGRVNQGGKHVDESGEEVAATQTILIYCKTLSVRPFLVPTNLLEQVLVGIEVGSDSWEYHTVGGGQLGPQTSLQGRKGQGKKIGTFFWIYYLHDSKVRKQELL